MSLRCAVLLGAVFVGFGVHAPEEWRLSPDLRVGGIDGPQALTTISDGVVHADGRIFVAQPQDNAVKVFDDSGRLVGSYGRRGGGPGEFEHPARMGWADGALWVFDRGLGRMNFLDPDGRPRDSRRVPVSTSEAVVLADGAVLAKESAPARSVIQGAVDRVPLTRFEASTSGRDTIAWLALGDQLRALELGGQRIYSTHPFGDNTLWDGSPDGSAIVLVDRLAGLGDGGPMFVVTKLTLAGDTIFSKRYPYTPRPISHDRIDAFIAEWKDKVLPDGPAWTEISHDRLRALFDLPQNHPPVSQVVVGAGTIWLRREDRGSGDVEWMVLDAGDGQVIAFAVAPRRLEIFHASPQAVWGVEHDDLEVPFLVRYRVEAATE